MRLITNQEVDILHKIAGAYNQTKFVDFDENQFPNWDLDKMEEAFRITEEIIRTLTPEAMVEIMNSCNSTDLDVLFDTILQEVYFTLYGNGAYLRGKGITSMAFGYLDKLTASVEETLRCEDVNYFITSLLPEFEMNWHHFEWGQIEMKIPRYAVIASRDHGKSYYFSNAVCAWRLYRFKGKAGRTGADRNPRGFLFSFSIQQAIDLLEILKNTITENDVLKEKLYNKDNWSKTDITCKNRARLTVKGFGSSVRGAHPGWIRIDDGLKDNVLYSKVQREKSNSYLQAVIMNMIVPGGSVGIVGTPFHNNDMYGELKTKKGWRVFEYPAIFPDGSLLWANRWNFQGLMEKKESQGNLIFSREILCKPITSDSTIFPIEVLNKAFFNMQDVMLVNNRSSYAKKFSMVVTGCDFAISGNVGADYSVFTTWGIDEMDRMWLMHIWRHKGASYTEQMAMLKWINSNFQPDVMMLENNVFQQIFVETASNEGLPVQGLHTGGRKNDLKDGWAGLAIYFDHGKIKIPTGDQQSKDVADMFVTEFTSIAFTDKGLASTSEHDDITSSTWLAKQAAIYATGGQFNFDFM